MVESNKPAGFLPSFFRQICKDQNDYIRSRICMIVVHDDTDQLESFKKISADSPHLASPIRVFDDASACQDYVCEELSDHPEVQFLVFVGGGLVGELISSIHAADNVKLILVLNKPPFNEKERESMKMYAKVEYVADLESTEEANSLDLPANIEASLQTRFSKPLGMSPTKEKAPENDTSGCVEPTDRSCKQFDQDFVFRNLMLLCLLNAPAFESDKADLIDLFQTDDLASPRGIAKFKETYSPSAAVRFYTTDDFIYGRLNHALRTNNIRHLVAFRFVLQDIFRQLNELMTHEANDEITVYRGQKTTTFEIADLLTAYSRRSLILQTSFFSTTKNREIALGFLDTAAVDLLDEYWSSVLFKITIRKQDASRMFPFADISSFSQHPEEREVLVAPGQIFVVNSVETSFQRDKKIYIFNLSLLSALDERFTRVHDAFQSLCAQNYNDSLLCLAALLVDFKRLDEAKDLYQWLASKYNDEEKKAACYEGLFRVSQERGDTDEAITMVKNMTTARFGTAQVATKSEGVLVNSNDMDMFSNGLKRFMNASEQLSPERPLEESLAYMGSDEYHGVMEQLPQMQYALGLIMVKNGIYDLAIFNFQHALNHIEHNRAIRCDPLLKARYYMQLGRCYRALEKYEQASENYRLALEQDVPLPLDEHIQTVTSFAIVLEAKNDYKVALEKYIEVAEIYQNNPTIGTLANRDDIEQAIQRVLSHLITAD